MSCECQPLTRQWAYNFTLTANQVQVVSYGDATFKEFWFFNFSTAPVFGSLYNTTPSTVQFHFFIPSKDSSGNPGVYVLTGSDATQRIQLISTTNANISQYQSI